MIAVTVAVVSESSCRGMQIRQLLERRDQMLSRCVDRPLALRLR